MDKIYIKGLEVFANHGVFKEEKNLGQKFVIDVELGLDLNDAGRYDELNKTVHYGLLSDVIAEEFAKKSYDLLEKATYELCKFILVNYDKDVTLREGGCLADIAPTLLEILGLPQPAEMTGKSLIIR